MGQRKNRQPRRKKKTKKRAPIETSTIEGKVGTLRLGTSVLRLEDSKLEVRGALPGEVVTVDVVPGRRAPSRASIVEPSPARVRPVCSIVDRCGACTIQSLSYPAQIAAKQQALRRALGSLAGGRTVPFDDIAGLPSPFGYRTRLLMPVMPGPKGSIVAGFYAGGTTRLVEATGCPVQHPLTLGVLASVLQVLGDTPVNATTPDTKNERGWLHGVGVRVDPSTSCAEVVLCGRTKKIPDADHVVPRLEALGTVHSLHLTASFNRSSYLYAETFRHVAGARRLAMTLLGRQFHLSPGSFFQTSHQGAELLAKTVGDMLPNTIHCLADLYGGVGIFARLNLERCRRAVVVESNAHAVGDLRAWIEHSGQSKLSVVGKPVESVLADVLKQHSPDVAIVDPPRSGCHERAVEALVANGPQQIVYVACGIEALRRDGKALVAGGYQLERVAAVDMFPHTSHLEVVASFRRPR